jgi:hypothetical protein
MKTNVAPLSSIRFHSVFIPKHKQQTKIIPTDHHNDSFPPINYGGIQKKYSILHHFS